MRSFNVTLNFLKKPQNSLPYLGFTLLFSIVSIFTIHTQPNNQLNLVKSFFVVIIPELATLSTIILLIRFYHLHLKLNQIKILPLFLIAFIVFFPFTFSVRFLIRSFPAYSFADYLHFLRSTFIVESYFLYLPPVIILGYTLLNVSLVRDFLGQSSTFGGQNIVSKAFSENKEKPMSDKIIGAVKNIDNEYLTILKVRCQIGETFIRSNDCYYFEATRHGTTIYHIEGKFWLSTRLIHLQEQLDPTYFFKSGPGHIINLAFLENYVYLANGRYDLNFKKPVVVKLNTTQMRIEALKVAFMNYHTLA
jgi:two-component system, LytTR family, response regulator